LEDTMTTEQKIIRAKVGLLELAKQDPPPRSARKALCMALSLGGIPGEGILKRASGPCR
jgi:hypothetical protein